MKRVALLAFTAATVIIGASAVGAQSASTTTPVLSPTLAPVAQPAPIATPAPTASPARTNATASPSSYKPGATPSPART